MSTNSKAGDVFWITGLAGSGKTTIGKQLHEILEAKEKCVFLDGDSLRPVLAEDLGYDKESRLKAAMRYSKLCKMLSEQGFNVICCTISMFNEIHEYNKDTIPKYHEIFLNVPIEILESRNQKNLYTNGSQTVGVQIQPELPTSPSLKLDYDESKSPEDYVNEILNYYYHS